MTRINNVRKNYHKLPFILHCSIVQDSDVSDKAQISKVLIAANMDDNDKMGGHSANTRSNLMKSWTIYSERPRTTHFQKDRTFLTDRPLSGMSTVTSDKILAFIVLCQNAQWARKCCLEIIYHLTTTTKITFQGFWALATIDLFLVPFIRALMFILRNSYTNFCFLMLLNKISLSIFFTKNLFYNNFMKFKYRSCQNGSFRTLSIVLPVLYG